MQIIMAEVNKLFGQVGVHFIGKRDDPSVNISKSNSSVLVPLYRIH